MLLDIERKILKKISKNPESNNFLSEDLPEYSVSEIRAALLQLQQKGYLEKVSASIDFLSFTYVLTSNGRFYREYHAQNFLKNIIIPVLVSIITTLLTMYLTH